MGNANQRSFQDVRILGKQKNANKTLKLSLCVTYEYFSPENSGRHLCWCEKRVIPSTSWVTLYQFTLRVIECALLSEWTLPKKRDGKISTCVYDIQQTFRAFGGETSISWTEIWSTRNNLKFTLRRAAKMHPIQHLFLLAKFVVSTQFKRTFLLRWYVMCGLDKFTRNSSGEKSFLRFCFILIEYEVMWGESCWCLSSFLILILTKILMKTISKNC